MSIAPIFIVALFIIAKTWKQPKCPMTNKEDVGYIYVCVCVCVCVCTMEYYLDIKKKNEIMPSSATGIDLETLILNEVSQTKSNIILCHLYVES